MDTLDSLTRRGYRIYKVNMKLTPSIKKYLRTRKSLLVDYHEVLKVITIRDAKSESELPVSIEGGI